MKGFSWEKSPRAGQGVSSRPRSQHSHCVMVVHNDVQAEVGVHRGARVSKPHKSVNSCCELCVVQRPGISTYLEWKTGDYPSCQSLVQLPLDPAKQGPSSLPERMLLFHSFRTLSQGHNAKLNKSDTQLPGRSVLASWACPHSSWSFSSRLDDPCVDKR